MKIISIEENIIFKESLSTLKETSKDDNSDEYMTNSEKEVIDFDLVKRKY